MLGKPGENERKIKCNWKRGAEFRLCHPRSHLGAYLLLKHRWDEAMPSNTDFDSQPGREFFAWVGRLGFENSQPP